MGNHRRGLRVIELMAIVGVVGVALGLATPWIAAARESARRTQCLNNLKQLTLALHNYAGANNDRLPPLLIDDPWDGNLSQNQSLHARIIPYVEATTIYNEINWNLPARWGPAAPANFDDAAGGGLWGAVQHTAATRIFKSFLCPSDPTPAPDGKLGWSGRGRRVAGNSYPFNIGLNRHINNWNMNGTAYIESSWDGTLKRSVSLQNFVDGTSNTAVFSEWVKGHGADPQADPGRNPLSLVYQAGIASDAFTGQLYADWLLAQQCHNCGLTRDWDWKGEWWIDGSRQGYSHTQTPNRRACNYDNVGVDGRGTITMMGASSFHPGGVNVAFMDGSVKFIKSSINYVTWYAIATPEGNEVVECSCR
jgi:prepilin-type processing-associated H-X9-DG protein